MDIKLHVLLEVVLVRKKTNLSFRKGIVCVEVILESIATFVFLILFNENDVMKRNTEHK